MAAVKKKLTKKTPSTTKASKTAKAKPKPKPEKSKGEPPPTKEEVAAWRALTQAPDFRVEILTGDGIQTVPGNTKVLAGRWCAAVPLVPSPKRYHFLLQWQEGAGTTSKRFVLCHLIDGAGAPRLPPAGGWTRALAAGKLHLLSADVQLTRRQIAAIIGGHEPKATPAKPPDT